MPVQKQGGVLNSGLKLLLTAWLLMSGCGGCFQYEPKAKSQIPLYRQVSEQCQNIKSPGPWLDPTTFRSFIRCLNARGTINGLHQWVEAWTDTQLEFFTQYLNRYWFSQPEAMNRLAHAVASMSDEEFHWLGQIFSQPQWWSPFLRMLKSSPSLLKVLQEKPDQYFQLLDQFLSSPVAQSLIQGIEEKKMVSAAYLTLTVDPTDLQRFLKEVVEGGFSGVWHDRRIFGQTPAELKVTVPAWAAIAKILLKPDTFPSFVGIAQNFFNLNREVSCLSEGYKIPNLMLMALQDWLRSSEMSSREYFQKAALVKIQWMKSVCHYPADLVSAYPHFYELAQYPEPVLQRLKALVETFAQNNRMNALVNAVASSRSLIPIFQLTEANGKLMDLFLLANLASDEAYQLLQTFMTALLADMPLITKNILSEQPQGFERFTVNSAEIWSSLFQLIKQGFARDSWLGQYGIQSLLEGGMPLTLVSDLFSMPEFSGKSGAAEQMVVLSEKLQLRPLLVSALRVLNLHILHRHDGQNNELDKILSHAQTEVMPVSAHRTHYLRHQLKSADLSVASYWQKEVILKEDPCRKLSLSFSIGDIDRPDYLEQLTHSLQCMNHRGDYIDLQKSVLLLASSVLNQQSTESPWAWTLKKIKSYVSQSPAGFSYWIGKIFLKSSESERKDFLESIQRWAESAIKFYHNHRQRLLILLTYEDIQGSWLKRLSQYLGESLADLRLPEFINLWQTEYLLPQPLPEKMDLNEARRLESEVRDIECAQLQPSTVEEIQTDFSETIHAGERLVLNWSPEVLQPLLWKIFVKLSQPFSRQWRPGNEGSLYRIFEFFNRRPAEELNDWLVQRSKTVKSIAYFYPGEDLPRVKIVSGLDQLELLMVNAQVLSRAFAHEVLLSVALAWGDEPEVARPQDLTAIHRKSSQTLQEAVQKVDKLLLRSERFSGYPKLPDCIINPIRFGQGAGFHPAGVTTALHYKKAIFNLRQLMPFIQAEASNGGLKVLRDLFYALWMATPLENRSSLKGDKNLLSLVHDFAVLGVFHRLSQYLRLHSDLDVAMTGFIRFMSLSHDHSHWKESLSQLISLPELQIHWQKFIKTLAFQWSSQNSNPLRNGFFLASLMGRQDQHTLQSWFNGMAWLFQNHGPWLMQELNPELLQRQGGESARLRFLAVLPEQDLRMIFLRENLNNFFNRQGLWLGALRLFFKMGLNDEMGALQKIYHPHYMDGLKWVLRALTSMEASAMEDRKWISKELQQGEFIPFIKWTGGNPDGINQILQTWIHSVESGQLGELSELIHQCIRDPIQ